jgi:hypothetical protein
MIRIAILILLIICGISFIALICFGVESVLGRILQHYVTCEQCGTYIFMEQTLNSGDVGECPFCGVLHYTKIILEEEKQNDK